MIKLIPFSELFTSKHGWLTSHFHFSFAEYSNQDNMHFGSLRVMNDDYIAPHSGFATHPHRDMEIITYIIEGELTHKDSMANQERLYRGEVQYLSAGTGITHSEYNESDSPLHLIQLWILPHEKSLTPQYGSKRFKKEERVNQWLQIVGSKSSDAPIKIYQDASIYVSELQKESLLSFILSSSKMLYLKLMEGEIILNALHIQAGDGVEIKGENIAIKALKDAHILVVEVNDG